MDSDSSEQQRKELTNVIPPTASIIDFKSYTFVFARYHSPCQNSKNGRACPAKSKIVPTSRLPLSVPARVHGVVKGGEEGRRALKPILEESARRNEETLELLKWRDFDTETDTVKTLFPTHDLGLSTFTSCMYMCRFVLNTPF